MWAEGGFNLLTHAFLCNRASALVSSGLMECLEGRREQRLRGEAECHCWQREKTHGRELNRLRSLERLAGRDPNGGWCKENDAYSVQNAAGCDTGRDLQ